VHVPLGGEEECMQGFGRKTRKKEQLGKLRCRWDDSIKMDYREIGWGCMGWIHLAQDKDQWRALVKTVIESSGSIKC
jgi:hypothetical protein